jgi:hypothetical protein
MSARQRFVWRCVRCRRQIGEVEGEVVLIAHGKRLIRAHLPCEQRCGQCGQVNRWPPAAAPAQPGGVAGD